MTWYNRVISALTSVTDNVSHGGRLSGDRYIVWEEDGGRDLIADNRHTERGVSGTADLFTREEFDPIVYMVGEAFDDNDICWRLISTQYEDETGYWHYEWEWECTDG